MPSVEDDQRIRWSAEQLAEIAPYVTKSLRGEALRILCASQNRSVGAVQVKLRHLREAAGVQLETQRTITAALDVFIRAEVAKGSTIVSMAKATGIKPDTISYHIRHRIKPVRTRISSPPTVRADGSLRELASDPLPVGHPLTWGLITAGTLLDGEPCRRDGVLTFREDN